MLTEAIKQNISSLSLSELEALCEKYLEEDGISTEEEFIAHLYHHKHITANEFRNVQTHGKVELTVIANISDIDDIGKKQSEPDGIQITGTYVDDEKYTVLESIDEGAMGEILVARDNKLNRTVAYKKILPHVAEIPSYLSRFYLEAQITAQLQHPNIVPVYEFVTNNQTLGYAMKLIDGITLRDHIRETQAQYNKDGRPDEHHTLHARLEHFLKVCDAMQYAHRKGVIHRDLKPLNIMIGPYNEVYVMDWGIAKTIDIDTDTFQDRTTIIENDDDNDKTMMGQVIGTPAYMSPEQAGGEHDILDHRSDLYALGLILFELVTFHRAYNGKSAEQIMTKACHGAIDPPPAYDKQDIEQEQLLAIVKKATQYLPEDRYETVSDFADDIRRFMHGEAIVARPESRKQKIMRWVTQHQKAAVNIMAYLILASFILVVTVLYQQIQTMKVSQSAKRITNNFVTAVANKSQHLDTHILKYEIILEGITIRAASLLNQESWDSTPYYTNETITDPQKGPEDYKFSEVYGFPISVDYHVYVLAPYVDEQKVKPILQKLNPLRHSFKSLVLKSSGENIAIEDTEKAHLLIRDEGLPIAWAFVGLEEGILADYPGRSGYPDIYDPRQRPWYRGSIGNTDISWLQPYIDAGGRGALIGCTSPIYSNEGKFIGVAAVELTVDYIRKNLMAMQATKGLEGTFLLNDKAEIIIASTEKAQTFAPGTLINSIEDLEIFPVKNIVDKIRKGQSGHSFFNEKGRKKIAAYHELDSTGWFFVATADAEKLMNTKF